MAKRRKQGHYCRICGEYKANEKFSGKGHEQHICKSCMSNMKKKDSIRNDDSGLFAVDSIDEWDSISMGDMYEPGFYSYNEAVDPIIHTEPEHRKYNNLNKDEKSALKELWIEIVSQYWREDRQIPFGEHYSRLKKELLGILEGQGDIALKDDNDLKVFLNDSMIITINKLLK